MLQVRFHLATPRSHDLGHRIRDADRQRPTPIATPHLL